MGYTEIDLATVRTLFPTAEATSEGDLGTDPVLNDWLRGGLNVAFYRAADHRLLARAVESAERPSGWLFNARYHKAQLESLYTNSPPSKPTCRREPTRPRTSRSRTTMSENTYDVARLDKAIEEITFHPETWNQSEWRCGTGMGLAGHIVEQNGDQWATGPEHRFKKEVLVPKDTPSSASAENYLRWYYQRQYGTVVPVTPEGMALIAADMRASSLLRMFGDHSLFDSGCTLEEIRDCRDMLERGEFPGYEDYYGMEDYYYDNVIKKYYEEFAYDFRIGRDISLDEGAYATLVQDDVQGWHLLVGSTRHEIWKAGSLEVFVEEFLQYDADEDVTAWDAAHLLELFDEALYGAGYRLDFTRSSQRYDYIAVNQLTHEDLPELWS